MLAVDHLGCPALLVKVDCGASTIPVIRRHVTTIDCAQLTVRDSDTEEVATNSFAIVKLRPEARSLTDSFAIVVGLMISSIPTSPSSDLVSRVVNDLARLLSPEPETPLGTVAGLWGELWLIANAPHTQGFADAWRRAERDLFDFSFEGVRLDVKTTLRQSRHHRFALGQLDGRLGTSDWIASIQILEDRTGESCMDLLGRIGAQSSLETRSRVERVAVETLGVNAELIDALRFTTVGESLRILPCNLIPRVSVPAHAAITDVSFSVDLDTLRGYYREIDQWLQEVVR